MLMLVVEEISSVRREAWLDCAGHTAVPPPKANKS
jgi:hypothetical protein